MHRTRRRSEVGVPDCLPTYGTRRPTNPRSHCPSPSPARPWSRGAPRVEERIGATPGGAIQAPKARRRVVPSGSEKVTAPKSMPKLLSRVPPLPGFSVTHTRHSLPPLFPQEHSILCPPSSARRGYSPRPSTIHRPPPSSSGADARCRWRNAVCGKALRARRARDEAEPLSHPPLPLSPVVRAPPRVSRAQPGLSLWYGRERRGCGEFGSV